MNSSSVFVDEDEAQHRCSRTQSLEMAFQEALRNTDSIVRDEDSRRLRLRIVMLENENDDLHEQLALGDDRIDLLEQECEDSCLRLDQALEDAARQESEGRLLTRELNNVKAELESMNSITTDSTKLLKEKLAITRELASIKPELEHFRTQASYQQSVLSEKLALERQVSTLEVELEAGKRALKHATQKNNKVEREADLQRQVEEALADLNRVRLEGEKAIRNLQRELDTEKIASKRASQKSTGSLEKEIQLQQQLEELQTEVGRERCQMEKISKDTEKKLKASEARETTMENKLDQMRAKLRATKDQLKESQAELTQVQAAATRAEPAKVSKNNRKRTIHEMSTDETIGTPDGVAARGKRPSIRRGRLDQTAVGEKSMFSITPYLNRTVNMSAGSPIALPGLGESDREEEEEEEEGVGSKETMALSLHPKFGVDFGVSSSPPAQQIKEKKKSLDKSPTANAILGELKANVKSRKPSQKKSRVASTLEKVVEEVEADENEGSKRSPTQRPEIVIPNQPSKKQPKIIMQTTVEDDDGEQKKKKRKLLGNTSKTLFDDEDAEAMKRPTKIALGPSRLIGQKAGFKSGLAAATTFGAFSPLKRDRRGVGASFLG